MKLLGQVVIEIHYRWGPSKYIHYRGDCIPLSSLLPPPASLPQPSPFLHFPSPPTLPSSLLSSSPPSPLSPSAARGGRSFAATPHLSWVTILDSVLRGDPSPTQATPTIVKWPNLFAQSSTNHQQTPPHPLPPRHKLLTPSELWNDLSHRQRVYTEEERGTGGREIGRASCRERV